MSRADLTPLLRMGERTLIVLGGILSIYLGYLLFTLGITTTQGEARAFGIVLRDFGPGLFFAALGAYVLVRAMQAPIRTWSIARQVAQEGEIPPPETQPTGHVDAPVAAGATFFATGGLFFGVEDPKRELRKWSAKSFFLDTRDLLRQQEAGSDLGTVEEAQASLQRKLDSITMTAEEYERYQLLTNKADMSSEEQHEFLKLEGKLFP